MKTRCELRRIVGWDKRIAGPPWTFIRWAGAALVPPYEYDEYVFENSPAPQEHGS